MKVIPSIDASKFYSQADPEAKIRFLLQYAHLAPSTHNTQPWLFKVGQASCQLYYDPALRLPEGDPLGRDLYISLGACIENLVVAAQYFGVYKAVKYFTDGGELVAEITFQNLDEASPNGDANMHTALLAAILKRFNARGLFQPKPASQTFLNRLQTLNNEYGPDSKVHLVTEQNRIRDLAELTAEGLRSAYHRPAFRAEIAGWIRPNFSKQRDGIPGYSLRMNLPLSVLLPILMRKFDIGKKLGQLNLISLSSAPLICVFTSKSNDPAHYLATGRLAERVMLEANAEGMKTSIFVASVEIDDLYKKVQSLLGTEEIPQFLMCVGHIKTRQGFTPRQPLESRIIK